MTLKTEAGLTAYMQTVVEGLRRDKKLAAVHTYTSTLHSVEDFYGGKGVAIPIDELFTPGRLKEYQEWLLLQEASWNTVSTYMRVLQAVYNRLYPAGSADHTPKLFDGVYTKVEQRVKRALTKEQMQTMITTNPDELPDDVKSALAYFILMFLFQGMPFIDLAYLRKRDIRGNVIAYTRHKTGRQMTVRIPPEAEALIKTFKEQNPNSPYLFPILNGRLRDEWQQYACYLKALRNINKKLEKIGKLLLPGVKISSYTARHTWATLAFHQGLALGIICKALGHSSIRVTETYLKPFEDEKMYEANNRLIESVLASNLDAPVTNIAG